MTQEELSDLAMQALAAAIDGDTDGAARTICEIGEKSSPQQVEVYAACCAYAEAARQALVKFYGDRAPDPARGGLWAMTHLPGLPKSDAPDLFALRFIVAYANNDRPTALALWHAALRASNDEYVASVASVLATAASLVRQVNKL